MVRKFLPVGQGAFYLERFDVPEAGPVNIVYDCGSSSGHGIVRGQIHSCFLPGEPVRAVFLSHFDADHVNGLEDLLRYGRVEHIFFPLLTAEDKALVRLQYLAGDRFAGESPFWLRFMADPLRALTQMDLGCPPPRLHPVRAGESRDEEEEFSGMPDDFRRAVDFVRSGEDVSGRIFGGERPADWRFVPFHFRERERRQRLKDSLTARLGTCDPEELLGRLESAPRCRAEIREAYAEVPGSFNTNSMALFSGTRDRGAFQFLGEEEPFLVRRDRRRFWYVNSGCLMRPGALYLGDYEAAGAQKWRALRDAYQDYFPEIGCLQVPHHGSRHHFHSGLLGLEHCQLYIMSAGCRNPFRHPAGSVIKQIVLSGKRPLVVTEQQESMVCLYILPG